MKKAGKIAAGLAALVVSAGAAMAADVPPMVIDTSPATSPVVIAQPGFDWGGPYVGAYAGNLFTDGGIFLTGIQAGYNFLFGDRFFAGVEAAAGIAEFEAFEGALTARAGAVLGDRLLVYAEAGIWTFGFDFDDLFVTLGGGAEFAVGDALSLFTEAAWLFDCGCAMVKAGINWHLGN